MILRRIMKHFKSKNINKRNKEPNLNFHTHIKPGDMVKLNSHAKEKHMRNERIHGKCTIPNCTCNKMFNKEFVGFVIEIKHTIAEVRWPDNIMVDISVSDIDIVSLEE